MLPPKANAGFVAAREDVLAHISQMPSAFGMRFAPTPWKSQRFRRFPAILTEEPYG